MQPTTATQPGGARNTKLEMRLVQDAFEEVRRDPYLWQMPTGMQRQVEWFENLPLDENTELIPLKLFISAYKVARKNFLTEMQKLAETLGAIEGAGYYLTPAIFNGLVALDPRRDLRRGLKEAPGVIERARQRELEDRANAALRDKRRRHKHRCHR